MESKLEVRNLSVSFKTNNGIVKAVRDISFRLNKGETLAIVGESGSGKSVTTKAILGILAGNSIIENGEIIYDGQDLLKFSEEDFNKIRGNKITMIFQDPLSSLDPIMKIGKQMTEATILNGRTNRKNAGKVFDEKVKELKGMMLTAGCESSEINRQIDIFVRFVKEGSRLEGAYHLAHDYAESAVMSIDRIQILLLGDNYQKIQQSLNELLKKVEKIYNEFLFGNDPGALKSIISEIKLLSLDIKRFYSISKDRKTLSIDKDTLKQKLSALMAILKEALSKEEPNFFTMGYYISREDINKLYSMDVAEMNGMLRQYIDEHFMISFLKNVALGLKYADENSGNHKTNKSRIEKQENSQRQNTFRRNENIDYDAKAVALIDHLKDLSYIMANEITKQVAYDKAIRIMEDVGIKEPEKRFNQYPFEFSGGMRQRIVIAIALAANPDVLICDEPTTALDVTIQAQILELINNLKRKRNLTVIFITHDLGVVANIADKVAVMYAGKIVEEGTVDDIFYHPAHPYTWALLSSMPDLDTKDKLEAIPGTPPNMIYPPIGDAFAARNNYAMQIDFERQPPMFRISDTHSAATWLLHPDAPEVKPPKQVIDRIERMKKLEEMSYES